MIRAIEIRAIEPGDKAEWLRMRMRLWPDHAEGESLQEIDTFYLRAAQGQTQQVPAEHSPAAVFVCTRSPDNPNASGLNGFIELALRNYAEGCDSPVPYIEGWYVDEDAQRQGIGRALVQAAEQWARQLGYRELASDAELDNLNSHRAHAALGFEEVERTVHFRKDL